VTQKSTASAHVEQVPRGYVPLAEAAHWASVSKKTLLRYIEQGLKVHQARPGSKLLVRLEDIRAFLKPRSVRGVDLGKLVDEVMAKVRG
jgi:hypothetical protein